MKKLTGLATGLAVTLTATVAHAQVFEVRHPDVEVNSFVFESLNGITVHGVDRGEEQSAHEIAIGYAPFSFWKTKVAVEIANPKHDNAEYEGFGWENIFLLPFGSHADGHHHGHDHHHGDRPFFDLAAVGFFGALEIPNVGGIDKGAVEVGPIAEMRVGPVINVANLFVEIPIDDDEDPGLVYALSSAIPFADFENVELSAGFEAHGTAEELFGDPVSLDDNTHVIGPALYSEIDVGRQRVLEPRVAMLFGLTNSSPDAVLSVNLELKF